MEGNSKIQYLIQSGAIGICLCLLFLWGEQNKRNDVLIGNHINHNTEALIKLDTSISNINNTTQIQTEVLRDLQQVILLKIQ